MTAELAEFAIAAEGNGPREGESFAAYLDREDAELREEVGRQITFLETASFEDLHLVLGEVVELVEADNDDPRIVAGVRTLARLLGHPAAGRTPSPTTA